MLAVPISFSLSCNRLRWRLATQSGRCTSRRDALAAPKDEPEARPGERQGAGHPKVKARNAAEPLGGASGTNYH